MRLISLLIAISLPLHAMAQTFELVKQWETEPVLFSAESVLYSAQDGLLFVSNMGPGKSPGAKDGDGSIGKVGLDGKIIDSEWIIGLDAPKGLGIFDGKLYVADIDRVVVIDVDRGEIDKTIAIEGAGSLNDLTVDDSGVVHVSDHKLGKVYALTGGGLADDGPAGGQRSVFVDDVENPNGILSHGKDFYILARGIAYQVAGDGNVKALIEGLDASVDGIENIRGDDFLVSCSQGIIYAVNVATGAKQTLFDGRDAGIQTADIGYDRNTRMVYVPTLFTHQVIAFKLNTKTSPLAEGQDYIVPDLGLEMRWIQPGDFLMGKQKNERGREEERQHRVTLSKGFWMGSYEVTVGEWSQFAASSGFRTEGEVSDGISVFRRGKWMMTREANWTDPGFPQTDDHPVVGVSWNDAMAFGRWLTNREKAAGRLPDHYEYTLPTEAQWEYACRAGATGTYSNGISDIKKESWIRYTDSGGKMLTKDHTYPVGLLTRNAWGLYDVHGNVFEWCRDWYSAELGDAIDPIGPTTGESRVCRGGSWFSYNRSVRSAFRGRDLPDRRGSTIGFRLSISEKK